MSCLIRWLTALLQSLIYLGVEDSIYCLLRKCSVDQEIVGWLANVQQTLRMKEQGRDVGMMISH